MKNKLNIPTPQDLPLWNKALNDLVFDSGLISSKEYSSQGVLEVEKKPDGTLTLFENNKPKKVLSETGELLTEYFYDAEGRLEKVSLINARKTLPDEIKKSKQKIEEERDKALLDLAKQKSLAYQNILSTAETQKILYAIELEEAEAQYERMQKIEVKGKQQRNQKADVLSEMTGNINDLQTSLTQVYRSEADAYAALDSQVEVLSTRIKTDSQKAFDELDKEELALKKEILRQEVSPVVYEHYRRILGRDPSSKEYDEWVNKIDYETGKILVGETLSQEERPTGFSAFFDGNGDSLLISDSPDWSFGIGDFTIDLNVKFKSLSGTQVLISQYESNTNYWQIFKQASGNRLKIQFEPGAGLQAEYIMDHDWNLSPDTWYHIAFERQGQTGRLFINGIEEKTLQGDVPFFFKDLTDINAPLTLGGRTSYGLNGNMFNVRISKGLARWTSNFASGTEEEYSPDSYTQFLLKAGYSDAAPFKDLSSYDRSVSGFGDTKLEATGYQTVTIRTPIFKEIAQALAEHLESLPELQERQAYVQHVKQKVTQKVNDFLLKSDQDKRTFAASLGLSSDEFINLTLSDSQKILAWFESRSLHFGQSAFLSLESLLDQKGISYAREDIAEKAILIDILTGVISPLDDGELVISVFALNKVAGLYGLDLSGANLSWADLKSLYADYKSSGVSGNFNNGDLSIRNSSDFDFGTGDFTIDYRFKLSSLSSSVIGVFRDNEGSNRNYRFIVNAANSSIGVGINSINTKYESFTPDTNWHHVAFVRSGTNLMIFLDGVQLGSPTPNSSDLTYSTGLSIGNIVSTDSGWMDGIRISKGIARWTSNFALPTQRPEADSYTKLLVCADPAQGIKDLSPASHSITTYGNVSVDASTYPGRLENYNPKVIAHINANHYVIITDITDTTITYIDPGIGEDKKNESLTVTKDGFLKTWKGYITLETNLANAVISNPLTSLGINSIEGSHLLSTQESQSVRGAFWGSVLSLAGSILSWIPIPGLQQIGWAITAISTAVAAVEGDFITAIGNIVTLGFSSIVGAFKTAFDGVLNVLGPLGGMLRTLGSALHTVYSGVVGFLNSAINFLPGIGSALQGAAAAASTTIGAQIVNSALSIGINLSLSMGLESIGVSPQIAGFFGSLTAGAVIGALSPVSKDLASKGMTQTKMIQSSVQQIVALNQIGQLGLELGLNSTFTNILGLSLAAIQGQAIQVPQGELFNLATAFSNIRSDLVSSFAQYGVTRLGEMAGLDSRVAGVIAAPIGSLVGGVGFDAAKTFGQNAINSIQNGLIHGIVSYGVNFVGESHPILGSLLSSDVALSVERALGQSGLFNDAFGILQKAVALPFNVIGGVVNTLGQGFSKFSDLVSQTNLSTAMESQATSMFSRSAQESIAQKGGVENLLNSTPKLSTNLPDGRSAQELVINGQNSLYFDNESHLIGRKDEGIYELGDFGYDSFGALDVFDLWEGHVYADMENHMQFHATVQDGHVYDIQFIAPDQEIPVLEVKSTDPEKPIAIEIQVPQETPNPTPDPTLTPNTVSYSFWNAALNLNSLGLSLFLSEGKAEAAEQSVQSTTQEISEASKKFLYTLVNGIANPQPNENIPPQYIANLRGDLQTQSSNQIQFNDVIPTPIYQPNFKSTLGNQIWDTLKWNFEAQLPQIQSDLVTKVWQDWSAYYYKHLTDLSRSVVGMGYSGGFIPLVETIAQSGFNVKSLVALGAATFSFSRDITNAIIGTMTLIGDWVLGKIHEELRPLLEPAFNMLGIIGEHIEETLNAILSKDLNRVAVLLSEKISEITKNTPSNLANLYGKGVNQIVNIWGTKDILLQTGIGGKRINLCGVADTVNIEIVGAEHGDYMRRGNENPKDPEDAWNRTVSGFVTDLIINSDTVEKRITFLNQKEVESSSNGAKVAQFDLARGVWIIRLTGWEFNQ